MMKAVAAASPSDLDAASPSKGISIQRDAMNLPPKLKRKMLTWAREESTGAENEAEVQKAATRLVTRLRRKCKKSEPKARTNAGATIAVDGKALDATGPKQAEGPSMPPPKKRKIKAEVEAKPRRSTRIRDQRIRKAEGASRSTQGR